MTREFIMDLPRPEAPPEESVPGHDKLCAKLGSPCCPARSAAVAMRAATVSVTPQGFTDPLGETNPPTLGWCSGNYHLTRTGSGTTSIDEGLGEDGGLVASGNYSSLETLTPAGIYSAHYTGSLIAAFYNGEGEVLTQASFTLNAQTGQWEAESPYDEDLLGPSIFPAVTYVLSDPWSAHDAMELAWNQALLAAEFADWTAAGEIQLGQGAVTAVAALRLQATWPKKWLAAWGQKIRFHYRILAHHRTVPCSGLATPTAREDEELLLSDTFTDVAVSTADLMAVTPNLAETIPFSELLPDHENQRVVLRLTGPAYRAVPQLRCLEGVSRKSKKVFASYTADGTFYHTEAVSGPVSVIHSAEPRNTAEIARDLNASVARALSRVIGDTEPTADPLPVLPPESTATTRVIQTPEGPTSFQLLDPFSPEALQEESRHEMEADFAAAWMRWPENNRTTAADLSSPGGLGVWKQRSRYWLEIPRPNIAGSHAASMVTMRWKVWTLNVATGDRQAQPMSGSVSWVDDAEDPSQPASKSLGPYDLLADAGEVCWVEVLPLDEPLHHHPQPVWEVV